MSFAVTLVVQPDIDVECSAVPVDSAGFDMDVMVLVTVGIAEREIEIRQ